MKKIKHIVFESGGIGSFMTTERVIEKEGKENVIRLFTDTLIEDEGLYKFQDDATNYFGVPLTRIADGRTPWEVFKDVRFLGNSRLAQCSHILKQKTAQKWLEENFQPDECILYLGIDWSEEHRTKAPTKNWHPYKVEFPMCEPPYLYKQDMLDRLKEIGIEIPKLYKLGFSHNNCGGRCIRGGQGHWIHLLESIPERFHEVEAFEKEMQTYLDRDDITILKRTVDKERQNLSLEKLRQEYEAGKKEQIDMFDIGGCGCFVDVD